MFYFLSFIVLIYCIIIFKRLKKYKYNPKKDYVYNLHDYYIGTVCIYNNQLQLPPSKYDTLFLEITLRPSIRSYLSKPYIEIDSVKHYFEYGATGVRYLNISHIKRGRVTKINCSMKTEELRCYGFTNNLVENSKTLIIAPHADDAELSSFGLYSWLKDVTIVTITAGENGVCNYCNIYEDKKAATIKKGELRAFDAITTPLMGGLTLSDSIALGYFGSRLEEMRKDPVHSFYSHIEGIKSIANFRKVSHCNIDLPNDPDPSYNNLKKDLKKILLAKKPKFIITPHPMIDSHPDHKESSYLIIELILELNLDTTLLLYTNHLSVCELYPHGEMGSTITLPPLFQDLLFDSIFSFEVNENLQKDKFFAIEAMHDLRDSFIQTSLKKAFKLTQKLFKNRLMTKDKSYFRRAVRSNELFFLAKKRDTLELLLLQRKE